MVDACMGYLKGRVAAALGNDKLGAPPQVYTALQTLKTCVNPHVGAVTTVPPEAFSSEVASA